MTDRVTRVVVTVALSLVTVVVKVEDSSTVFSGILLLLEERRLGVAISCLTFATRLSSGLEDVPDFLPEIVIVNGIFALASETFFVLAIARATLNGNEKEVASTKRCKDTSGKKLISNI